MKNKHIIVNPGKIFRFPRFPLTYPIKVQMHGKIRSLISGIQ